MFANSDRSTARQRRRWLLPLLIAVVASALGASIVLAQSDLGGKLRIGNDVRVGPGETVQGDLYAFGGSVTVDANVPGDVVVAGGTISVNGRVGGDVIVAGGLVNLNGEVAGDVRSAGGQLNVNGPVGEDALLAGGNVGVSSRARIGEDLILSAGDVNVAGAVGGNIIGNAGTYSRTGSVGGTEEVVVGPRDRQPIVQANPVLDAIRHFLAVLLVSAAALVFLPRLVDAAEGTVRTRPLTAAGWGIAGFIGWIVLLVVIAIVMVIVAVALATLTFGALAALDVLAGILALLGLVLAFVVVAGFLADGIVGLALARRVAPDTGGDAPARARLGRAFLLLAAGAAVIVLLTSLPIVGGLVKLVVAVLGLGALLFVLARRREPPRQVAAGA